MSLQQLILNKNSSSESSYLLDIKENPIIHFSIEGPKDFEFKLYYNGSFNTIMKIPNNEFLELSSKIINIEKVEFFIFNLKDFEKVVFNYETIEKSNSSLNQASKDQIVQYIQGPPGPQGPQGASIKNIIMTDSEVNILLDNGKNITINGTFVGTGIKNIEDNQDGTFTIYLTDNSNYIIRTIKGEKGDIGLSAYELAQQEGYQGTLEEWLNSLKGEQGPQGATGAQGPQGATGAQGPSGDGIFSGTQTELNNIENQDNIYLWIDTTEGG